MLFKVVTPVVVNAPVTSNVLLNDAASDTANVLFKVVTPVVVNAPVIFVAPITSNVLFNDASPWIVIVVPKDASLDTCKLPLISIFALALLLNLFNPTLLFTNNRYSFAFPTSAPAASLGWTEIPPVSVFTDNVAFVLSPEFVKLIELEVINNEWNGFSAEPILWAFPVNGKISPSTIVFPSINISPLNDASPVTCKSPFIVAFFVTWMLLANDTSPVDNTRMPSFPPVKNCNSSLSSPAVVSAKI